MSRTALCILLFTLLVRGEIDLPASDMYIGHGSATIEEEDRLNGLAFRRAAAQIAEQISLEISSRVENTVRDRDGTISSRFEESLSTAASQTLEGIKINSHTIDPETGIVRCRVSLSKARWTETVHNRQEGLAQRALAALAPAKQPIIRLRKIADALNALNSTPWKYLRWSRNGDSVCLYDELIRTASSIGAGISIEPQESVIRLRGCAHDSYQWQVRLVCGGIPQQGATIVFSSVPGGPRFTPASTTNSGGYCRAVISSFIPRAGRLPVLAVLDLGENSQALVSAGVPIPAAEMTFEFQLPAVFITGDRGGEHVRLLRELIAQRHTVLTVSDSTVADYRLSSSVLVERPGRLSGFSYRAVAGAELILTNREGRELLRVFENDVAGTHPSGPLQAESSARKQCLKKIAAAFLDRFDACGF